MIHWHNYLIRSTRKTNSINSCFCVFFSSLSYSVYRLLRNCGKKTKKHDYWCRTPAIFLNKWQLNCVANENIFKHIASNYFQFLYKKKRYSVRIRPMAQGEGTEQTCLFDWRAVSVAFHVLGCFWFECRANEARTREMEIGRWKRPERGKKNKKKKEKLKCVSWNDICFSITAITNAQCTCDLTTSTEFDFTNWIESIRNSNGLETVAN